MTDIGKVDDGERIIHEIGTSQLPLAPVIMSGTSNNYSPKSNSVAFSLVSPLGHTCCVPFVTECETNMNNLTLGQNVCKMRCSDV